VKQLTHLFSSFEGRVSRKMFWWAGSLMFAAQIALTAAIARTVGLGWRDFIYADRRALWINLVVIAFFFWPSLALCIKRLHDRDLPGWWAGLLHVLLFIFYIDQAAMRPLLRNNPAVLLSLVPVAMLFLVGSWLIVELAFLNGTRGENRFGLQPSDDVSGTTARSPLARGAIVPKPGE
jgi:uncharacterized membrane protein YhaH (DUF805 family)